MRILHIADLHLGLALGQFTGEGFRKIRDEIDLALRKLEEALKVGYYDGLIVVGDVFEDGQVNRHYMMTMTRLFEAQLSGGGFVCYANGNHDHWVRERNFASLQKNEKFFLFLDPEIQSVRFQHKGETVIIHGLGYNEIQPSRDVTELFPPRVGASDDIIIGLLHGDIAGPGKKSDYYSLDPLKISYKNYNYFALGHIHKAGIFYNVISYPGTPFPQGYDETDVGSANEVLIDKLSTRIETKSLVNYRIFNLKQDIYAESREAVILQAQKALSEAIAESDFTNIVKMELIIRGPRSLGRDLHPYLAEDVFGPSSRLIPTLITHFIEEEKAADLRPLDDELLSSLDEAILRFKEGRARTKLENKLTKSLDSRITIEDYDIRSRIIADMEVER